MAKKSTVKKSAKKPGPPPIALDMTVVEGMAIVGASNVEIADFLGVHESTISKRCQDVLTKARADLKRRLRRAQLRAAIRDGNPAMLIWLGKQMLGQKDVSTVETRELPPVILE